MDDTATDWTTAWIVFGGGCILAAAMLALVLAANGEQPTGHTAEQPAVSAS